MNFLEGTLGKKGNSFYVKIGNDTISISKATTLMEKHIGEEVKIGIRPEDIVIDSDTPHNLKGTLSVQENLGSEAYIYIDYKGVFLTAKSSVTSNKESGEEISFSLKSDKIHIFSLEKGENISIDL